MTTTDTASVSSGFTREIITTATEVAFSEWHARLIKNDDEGDKAEAQNELIDALQGGAASFAPLLRDKLELKGVELNQLPDLPRRLTSAEASTPPVELERELWQEWQNRFTPHNAAKPIYWNLVYLNWIETDQFGGDLYETFVPKKAKKLDDRVRSLLRNIGGLPIARGNVSTFSDCPMARAWWRCWLVTDAVEKSQNRMLTFETAHKALHRKTIWESLVLNSLRRVTLINDPYLRAALVDYLADPDTKATNSGSTSQLIRNVAQLALFCDPALLDRETLQRMVHEAAEGIDEKSSAEKDPEIDAEADAEDAEGDDVEEQDAVETEAVAPASEMAAPEIEDMDAEDPEDATAEAEGDQGTEPSSGIRSLRAELKKLRSKE